MAARYWVGGNDNWDGTAGTKWATTSGGAGGAAVPTSADDVFLDNGAGTGNVTITASATCKALDCTGYVNTLAGSSALQVNGSIIVVAGMTLSYTGTITVNATSTITSNGQTFPGSFIFLSTITITLADAFVVTGNFTLNAGGTSLFNGFTASIGGNFAINAPFNTASTTSFILNGTGTWSGGGRVCNNLEINTAGTITISGSPVVGGVAGNVLKYTAGTAVTTGSTLVINGNYTINTGSLVWNNITSGGTGFTATLSSDLLIGGNLSIGTSQPSAFNGFSVYIGGNLTLSAQISGTSVLRFNGTTNGTWSGNLSVFNSVSIEKTGAGTLTISGTVIYRAGTLTYVSGTVTTTSSTVQITATCTLNTAGISFNNIDITTGTITLNSLLTVTGTLSVGTSGNVSFIGTNGFTCGTFNCVTAGRTITFTQPRTYTVTSNLTITGSSASRVTFTSSSTGALFNLQVGATQSVQNCNATWIDSSGGQTIYTSAGTLSNTTNWSISGGNFFLMF